MNLAPRHEAAFFRDVAIPAGLPVFTVKDRRLVGSTVPEPFDDDWGKAHLAELARRVAEQERRYDDIEVKARAAHDLSPHVRVHAERPVRRDIGGTLDPPGRPGLPQFAIRWYALAGGWQDTTFQIPAYDGEWTR